MTPLERAAHQAEVALVIKAAHLHHAIVRRVHPKDVRLTMATGETRRFTSPTHALQYLNTRADQKGNPTPC